MQQNKIITYINNVLEHMPSDWLGLTTHRLDIYNEEKAKSEFLTHFEALYQANTTDTASLSNLPTAYDYIRLGHPLSCVLEWAVAKNTSLTNEQIISFSSSTTPILSILRYNLLNNKKTRILYTNDLPAHFGAEIIQTVYGYSFEIKKIDTLYINF